MLEGARIAYNVCMYVIALNRVRGTWIRRVAGCLLVKMPGQRRHLPASTRHPRRATAWMPLLGGAEHSLVIDESHAVRRLVQGRQAEALGLETPHEV